MPVKLRRIDRLGLTPHVDKIFTTDTVGHNKPHPQAFLQVLEYYHAAAENCVMIGDRPPIDLMAAHELGMRTIWLQEGATSNARTHSFAYVDAEAQTMDDLPSIIASFANFHQTTAQAAQKHSSKSSKHILTTL